VQSKVKLGFEPISDGKLIECYCPNCRMAIPSKIINNLTTGEYDTCPNCNHILKGEELGIKTRKTEEKSSIISDLASAAQTKKVRKLKAYYCPYCNDPSSKLNENQLNLLEMGMVIECSFCKKFIKKKDLLGTGGIKLIF
ncbi:MAG: hypothetical protein ACFFCM_02740, partial [Promethearchaeota archaeon]